MNPTRWWLNVRYNTAQWNCVRPAGPGWVRADRAIIIDRDDLPEVVRGRYTLRVGDDSYGTVAQEYDDYSAAEARAEALRLLALAEYLDAHPPVDQAQVDALAKIMDDMTEYPWSSSADFARRVLATGKVRVKTEAE